MGLDAVVYRSKLNLPFDVDAVGARLERETGEYYFSDPALESKYPSETRIALRKRLGTSPRFRSCGSGVSASFLRIRWCSQGYFIPGLTLAT
jgi:hypothetical protein